MDQEVDQDTIKAKNSASFDGKGVRLSAFNRYATVPIEEARKLASELLSAISEAETPKKLTVQLGVAGYIFAETGGKHGDDLFLVSLRADGGRCDMTREQFLYEFARLIELADARIVKNT